MSSNYLKLDEVQISDFSHDNVSAFYDRGFLFTRLAKGVMHQTRSLRIELSRFELNSENRRVLKATEGLGYEFINLPYEEYDWSIHKLGKEFYTTKFGDDTMSASKIKEMFTDTSNSNMNAVFRYLDSDSGTLGYALCYQNDEILHYAYPFYDLSDKVPFRNLGMGMMLRSIIYAKESGMKFVYLGSVVDSTSRYKLQFKGLQFWDEEISLWSEDIENLKSKLIKVS